MLKQGYGKKTFGQNVGKLVKEGKKPNQAVAIAYDIKRKNKRDVASTIEQIQKWRQKGMKKK